MKLLSSTRLSVIANDRFLLSALAILVLISFLPTCEQLLEDKKRLNKIDDLVREMQQIVVRTQDKESRQVFSYFMAHMVPARPSRNGIRYLKNSPQDCISFVLLSEDDEKLGPYWRRALNCNENAAAYYDPVGKQIIVQPNRYSLRTNALISLHEAKHAYGYMLDPGLVNIKPYPGLHELETLEFGWRLASMMSRGNYQEVLNDYILRIEKLKDSSFKDPLILLPVEDEKLNTLYGADGPAISEEDRDLRKTLLAYDALLRSMAKRYPKSQLRQAQVRWVTVHFTSLHAQ
jgi:hypothetical protein